MASVAGAFGMHSLCVQVIVGAAHVWIRQCVEQL